MIKVLKHAGIVKQGDCGACCLGALLNVPVETIYDIFGRKKGLSYGDIVGILQKLGIEHENFLPKDEFIDNRPDWFTFNRPAFSNWMSWFDLSIRRIKQGYIGIAFVNSKGIANIDPFADHFVLITVEKNGSYAKDKMVNISCSNRGEFSVTAHDFLMKHGGYNTIWVKPTSICQNCHSKTNLIKGADNEVLDKLCDHCEWKE